MAEQQTRYGSFDRRVYETRLPISASHYSLPPNFVEIIRPIQGRPVNNENNPEAHSSSRPDGDLSHSYSIQTITSIRPEYAYSDRFYAGERTGGKMSSIRRFFCLFVTFDLLFTSLMWLICIMLKGENIMDAFTEQIYNYNIHTSLFDIVMCAVCRFVSLLLFYALLYVDHWIIISLTTSLTCAFLLGKVFTYNWQHSSQQVFEVLLVITSFVTSWAEAWFLDFKVIPQEQYAQQFIIGGNGLANAATPLMQNFIENLPTATESIGHFYSPLNSPEPSVHNLDLNDGQNSQTIELPAEEKNRLKAEATTIFKDAWDLLKDEGWKLEKSQDNGDKVYLLQKKGLKIYKLISVINAPARYLLEDLFYKVYDIPNWNPSVIKSDKSAVIDEYTDVVYQVSANAGGGIITSRDFVSLRRWGIEEGSYVIAFKGIDFGPIPKNSSYVRGINGTGCYVMSRDLENTNQTIFQWILNTDIKGWIPSYVLDPAFVGMLFDFTKFMRVHVRDMDAKGQILYDE